MTKQEQIEEMTKDFKSYLPNAWYNDKCVNGEVYSITDIRLKNTACRKFEIEVEE